MVFKATFNNILAISLRSVNAMNGFKLITLVVIGTDCIGSCKSNYHTTTTTTAPLVIELYTFKLVQEVTSIEQSHVLKGYVIPVSSYKISYEFNHF